MEKFEVLSPVGGLVVERKSLAPRLDTLQGKTIGETWNEDFKGDFMFPIYRELFKERFPRVQVIPYTEFPSSTLRGTPEYQQELARRIAAMAKEKGCDALISGNGG